MTSFATRQALRAYAADKPEPIRDLVHVICCQLWERAPPSLIAENLERLRKGEGMGRSQL